MATPVLTTDLITINDCNTVTGWSGDTFVLDPDLKKEGSNSVSCQSTTNGVNRITCAVASVALGTEHIRLWFSSTCTSYWSLLATRLQLEVVHSGGTAIWNLDPNAVYAGGWLNIVVYGGSTPDSGTAIGGNNCTSISIVQNTTSKPRGTLNTFVDYVRYGEGIVATGGTDGDEIDLAGIVAEDIANGYGIIEVFDDVYFISGEIQIGNGATTTWFKDTGQVAIFSDKPVLSTLYKILFTGSGCRADIVGGFYSAAASQTFTFDAANASVFAMTGKQVVKSDGVSFGSGQSITGNVFDTCGQVDPTTATFTDNTIKNSTDASGAMKLALVNNTNNITFDNNTYDVYIVESGTYNNEAFKHGTNTADLRYDNASVATFNVPVGGDTATVSNVSGIMTIVAGQKTYGFTLSPNITGYEWRVYTVTAVGSMAGAIEIQGEEVAASNVQSFSHSYAGQAVAVQILPMTEGYEEILFYDTLTQDSNVDRPQTLSSDINA